MDKGKKAEDFVHYFAQTAYLKHWCFPNPIDESGDRKEICDLLILFNDTCIIVSIKNYDLNGDYTRFGKKVIEKSTNQLYGAERKLFKSNRNIEIRHPERGIVQFDPLKYSKIIRLTINMGELFESFPLGDMKNGKGFINIIHRDSFSQVIKELNTIPELVEYLLARELLLISRYPFIIKGTELDLLAFYLLNLRSFDSDIFNVAKGTPIQLRNTWKEYNEENQDVRKKREEDQQSYIIDKLVERDILKEPWGEIVARELMNLSRADRRYLTHNIYEVVEKYKNKEGFFARRHFELNGNLYLIITYPVDTAKEDIDLFIENAGAVYMYKTDYKYEKIIILGAKYDLSESKFGIVSRTGDENEEGKKYLEELCSAYGWFQNMMSAETNFKTYPTD